jgi:cell division protein FtsW
MKNHKSSLINLVFILIGIGLVFISISSLTEANNTIGDKFFYLKKQGFWLLISLIVFYIASKINLKIIKQFSFLFYLGSILGLILVLIPGLSNVTLGAKRWLNLGIFSFQPSELLKLSSVIYFATLFSNESKRNFISLIFYLIGPFILIILEPNLSTAILISAIIITMFYLAGGKILPIFCLCLSLIFLSFVLVISSPYRFNRLKTLLNPTDSQTNSYHSNQIILSLSSGGFFGKGFANSDQKYRFLPKISTDSILAIIGEETGFLGVTAVLLVYLLLIYYLIKISSLIKDDSFSSLLVSGVTCWIAYQCLINISAIANIIPLTGVPLPFISYGGSSLLTLMTGVGLVRNVEKKHSMLLYSNNESNSKKNYHHRHSSHSRIRTYSSTSRR